MTRVSKKTVAELRRLLDLVYCCGDYGADYSVETWGETADRRPSRVIAHCQVPLAMCDQGHEGMLRKSDAELVVGVMERLPSILETLSAALAYRDSISALAESEHPAAYDRADEAQDELFRTLS